MAGYQNPVIPGFHPDPSVCRGPDAYYLATSSFTWAPGVPIFRSENLTEWTLIGNALDRDSQLDLRETAMWASFGIYAPTLRFHAGRFWMITTVNDTARGPQNFFVTADDPAGPWSDPVPVDIPGIDPDIAWDDDGNCWVHHATDQRIERTRIDDASGAVLEGPEPTWSGVGLQYPEAPHLYEIDGRWYLLIAEGGTERGHAVSIARGDSPRGPWEGCPANPILSHRSTMRPIQNTGHADLVQADDGSWWLAALAVRPRGMTPSYHVLGRETFLTSVSWVDGWPEVEPIELKPESGPPGAGVRSWAFKDEFAGPALGPAWLARRTQAAAIADLETRPGWLTLTDDGTTLDDATPTFVGCRQQHLEARAHTVVDVGSGEGGLAIVMDEHAHYRLAVDAHEVRAVVRIGPVEQTLASWERSAGPVQLAIETVTGGFGPDRVRLCVIDDGEPIELAAPDGRYLSTEVGGGFLGRVIGLYASGGTSAFESFALGGVDDVSW